MQTLEKNSLLRKFFPFLERRNVVVFYKNLNSLNLTVYVALSIECFGKEIKAVGKSCLDNIDTEHRERLE